MLIWTVQLFGMETSYQSLPSELKQEIINLALAQTNNLTEAISMIQKLSALHKINYDNLNDFNRLVHVLAQKFNTTTYDVAQKFNTETSTRYLELASQAVQAIMSNNSDALTKLIQNGLDVNYTFDFGNKNITMLILAVQLEKYTIIKLLLKSGANPHAKSGESKTALDYAKKVNLTLWDREKIMRQKKIMQLITDAMNK
jgi:hypothetical protein